MTELYSVIVVIDKPYYSLSMLLELSMDRLFQEFNSNFTLAMDWVSEAYLD